MKFNRYSFIALITLSLFFYGRLSVAQDFSAEFTGELCMSACSMHSTIVPMGTVSLKAFPQVGARANATRFKIDLFGCPPNKKIYLNFSPGEKNGGIQTLKNGNSYLRLSKRDDAASGFVLGLMDDHGNLQTFADETKDVLADAQGNASVEYVAFYERVSDVVKSGVANAISAITVGYDHRDN